MSAPQWTPEDRRLAALRRFAVAITVLNLLGHTVLGFEQSWAQPLIALATTYLTELGLETVEARVLGRRPRYAGGPGRLVDFLLPAHITGLAVSMLLYANERLAPVAFAAAVAIASKTLFRAPQGRGYRHFFNPSNFGIVVTLLVFPWVGIAPPYQFTEMLTGPADWMLPLVIVCSGTFLNGRFTGRLPLVGGWLAGFALQALVRSLFFGTPVVAALLPMTGTAFVLFTFYMVTDPGTTPVRPRAQVLFGAAVAFAYSVLMMQHIVFGLFFSLAPVCAIRGALLHATDWLRQRSVLPAGAATDPQR